MSKRGHMRRLSGYLFVLPYLVLFGSFLVLPLVYGLCLSLFRWEMLSPAPPKFIGLGNYAEALRDPYFWKALGATARFCVMSVPLTIVCALLASMGINAVRGRRQSVYRAAYFLPLLIGISVAGILWRWFYNSQFGLFNACLADFGIQISWLGDTRWAMKSIVLMTLWWTVGGPAVVLLAGLQQIPAQYYEAAAIDGANRRQQFLHVTLPQLRPVLLFVAIMNVIGSFQVFGQAFMVTRGGPEFSTRVLVQY
ncbi:MAG: multiple sugar transport system permease protein, partial [Candidatus Hydrogenedentes bacterium]|nr:multiple sugar transport system permease protein [Candidatus Hydrogenedentota bacterium]